MGATKRILAALTILFCILYPVNSAKGCRGLRNLENGQTFFRYGGLLVIFNCRHGYKLHGHKTNSCVSGHWSREPPICVGSGCPSPGPVAHGSISVNDDASWVVFKCDTGYKLVGPSMLYCKGPEWNSSKPSCEESDLMLSLPSSVTAQKTSVSQTFQEATHLKTKLLSHYQTLATLKDATQQFDMFSSRMTTGAQQPFLFTRSSQKQETQIQPVKPNGFLQESQTLLTPVTASKNYITTHALTTAITKTIWASTAYATTSGNAPSKPATTMQFTALSDKPMSQNIVTSLKTDKDQTTQNAFQSLQSIPQPLLSTSSTHFSSIASTIASTPSTTSSSMTPYKKSLYSKNPTPEWTERRLNITSSNVSMLKWRKPSCPYPPVPAHGKFYFSNKDTSGSIEFGHYIQYVCYPGFNLAHGDAQRFCQQVGTWSGVTPVCLDVDECAEGHHRCQHKCINTFGSFQCSCDVGYQPTPDQMSCTDVDECVLPTAVTGCVFGCVNTPGSFYCQCPTGYRLQSADAHCQDIDECSVNGGLGPCSELCHNSPGSYHCSCSYGHTLAGDGSSCINECPSGYKKPPRPQNSTLPPKDQCEDINECEEETCEWQCVNLPGSYRCICPKGYTPARDRQGCRDINECIQKNGGCSHLCINRRGSYKCACPPSHRLSPYSWKKCILRQL